MQRGVKNRPTVKFRCFCFSPVTTRPRTRKMRQVHLRTLTPGTENRKVLLLQSLFARGCGSCLLSLSLFSSLLFPLSLFLLPSRIIATTILEAPMRVEGSRTPKRSQMSHAKAAATESPHGSSSSYDDPLSKAYPWGSKWFKVCHIQILVFLTSSRMTARDALGQGTTDRQRSPLRVLTASARFGTALRQHSVGDPMPHAPY